MKPGEVIDADLSAIWYSRDDMDKSFYYLTQCVDKQMGAIHYFPEYPAYNGIKDDPGFEALKKGRTRPADL